MAIQELMRIDIYQELLEDVKSGQVTNIIVKDMSVFRDYITLGDYLENIFPFLV